MFRYICKESRKNGNTNDKKVGEEAKNARPIIENEKQNPIQFVSV